MAKLSFQFHAAADDVRGVLEPIASNDSIWMSGIFVEPKEIRVFDIKELPEIVGRLVAVCFTLGAPKLGSESMSGFSKANPDALLFEIGRLTDRGLQESWIYAMSDNETAINYWRVVVSKVKSKMCDGVFALSPISGTLVPVKGHRFAAGAESDALRGTRMLPAAGNSLLVKAKGGGPK